MSDLKKGKDILAEQVTPEKGVSDVGIEIRRGDTRKPGVVSHGYGRVSTPEFHKQKAKNHLKRMVSALKAQPKPDLPKSEHEDESDKMEKAEKHLKKIISLLKTELENKSHSIKKALKS